MERVAEDVFGERIVFHADEDGNYYCPVCGHLWEGSAVAHPEAFATNLEHCLDCSTHIGNEDIEIPFNPENPAPKRWAKLRRAWLEKHGWDPELIARVEQQLRVRVDKPSDN